jgi:hypothetical protein
MPRPGDEVAVMTADGRATLMRLLAVHDGRMRLGNLADLDAVDVRPEDVVAVNFVAGCVKARSLLACQ